MKNKMITLDERAYEIAEEVSKLYEGRNGRKKGGFSWWIRKQLKLFDEGIDIVEEREHSRRLFNACERIAQFSVELYSRAYPDLEPIDANLMVARAINQRDIREWIE